MICVGYPSSFSAHLLVELIEAGQGLAAGRGGSAPHQNMRLIQSVVPGVHSPEFAAEARRQWRLVAQSTEEAEIQAFIDSVDESPADAYNQCSGDTSEPWPVDPARRANLGQP
jgi:hypothetical protein